MNKKLFYLVFVLNLDSTIFDNKGNFIYENDIEPPKKSSLIAITLSTSIIVSSVVTFLFFNVINNGNLERELQKSNQNMTLNEINKKIKHGFMFFFSITLLLIYIYCCYSYDMEKNEI